MKLADMNLESLESVKKSADLAEDARLVGPLRGAREIPAVRQGPIDRDVHLCCPARRRAGIVPDLTRDQDFIRVVY